MKTIFSFTLLLFCLQSYALDFKAQLWDRENCRVLDLKCIPHERGEPQVVHMERPAGDRFKRKIVFLDGYEVQFIWIEKVEPVPHFIFQMEILDQNQKTMTLCSRYESIDTFEETLVGACSGQIPGTNKLIGVSLLPL